ncbi:MAG: arsenate reductase ArsC [Flavobacteriaceae bacterium]
MKNILVLCTGNSCRSQMAHGLFEYFTGGQAQIYSAGIETHGLNPKAVAAMERIGIDISQNTSNHVDEYGDISFDYIITVCDHAAENCPIFPSKDAVKIHQNFSDPSKLEGSPEAIEAAFDQTRNEIAAFVEKFVKDKLAS